VPGQYPARQFINANAIQFYLASIRRSQAGQAFEQGGLAAAVSSEQAPETPWLESKI
jgi:hypothetical protein